MESWFSDSSLIPDKIPWISFRQVSENIRTKIPIIEKARATVAAIHITPSKEYAMYFNLFLPFYFIKPYISVWPLTLVITPHEIKNIPIVTI